MNRVSTKLLLGITATFAIVGGVAYLYQVDPHKAGGYPSCPFFALTGLYCPGCGSLRAMFCLLHGHFTAASTRNVLALILLPIAAYSAVLDATGGQRLRLWNRQLPLKPLPFWTPHAVLVIVILYWLARNLPWYPFTLLAPHVGRFG